MTERDPTRRTSRRPMIVGAIVIAAAVLIFAVSMGGSVFDNREHAPAVQDTTPSGTMPGAAPPAAH